MSCITFFEAVMIYINNVLHVYLDIEIERNMAIRYCTMNDTYVKQSFIKYDEKYNLSCEIFFEAVTIVIYK